MGIFDFVKGAGQRAVLQQTPEDAEAKKQAAAAKAELEKQWKTSQALRQQRAAQTARERAQAVTEKKQAAVAKAEAEERAHRIKQFQAFNKAASLEKIVRELDLGVDGLDVRFHEGIATITGTVADQATRERAILAIGNVEGVESVHDEIEVASETAESATHVVKSGDTLWAIAQAQYGDGNRYPDIFEANRPMLSDPDKIYPGQVLRIPIDV